MLDRPPARSFIHPMLDGDHGCLGAVGDLQLGEDGADVIAHRAFREVELLGDFAVGQAAPQQAQDGDLAFAQPDA